MAVNSRNSPINNTPKPCVPRRTKRSSSISTVVKRCVASSSSPTLVGARLPLITGGGVGGRSDHSLVDVEQPASRQTNGVFSAVTPSAFCKRPPSEVVQGATPCGRDGDVSAFDDDSYSCSQKIDRRVSVESRPDTNAALPADDNATSSTATAADPPDEEASTSTNTFDADEEEGDDRASAGGSAHGKGVRRSTEERLADCSSHRSEISFQELHLYGPGGSRFIGRSAVRQIFTDEKATIFVGTWNLAGVAGNNAPSLRNWLMGTSDSLHMIDIYALSLQEVPSMNMCIHQSIVTTIGDILGTNFVTFFWVRKWAQILLVFVRSHLLPLTSDPQWKFVPSGVLAKPAKTKGAIAVVFRLCHVTLLFVGCHLSYGPQVDRIKDYHKIKKLLRFSAHQRSFGASESAVDDVDHVFWFGDMNFKVTDAAAMAHLMSNTVTDHALSLSAASGANALLLTDQLNSEMNKGTIFEKFTEPPIHFRPTYKFCIGTSDYNSKRTPSYTDRILHRHNKHRTRNTDDAPALDCLRYTAIDDECSSDHKPVVGVFRLRVIPKEIVKPRSSSVPHV